MFSHDSGVKIVRFILSLFIVFLCENQSSVVMSIVLTVNQYQSDFFVVGINMDEFITPTCLRYQINPSKWEFVYVCHFRSEFFTLQNTLTCSLNARFVPSSAVKGNVILCHIEFPKIERYISSL